MDRKHFLDEACKIINGERNDSYGDPVDNWGRMAELLNTVLAHKLSEPLERHDIAIINIAQKIGRLAHDPTRTDSWVDIAGYAACAAEVASTNTNVARWLTDTLPVSDINLPRWEGHL